MSTDHYQFVKLKETRVLSGKSYVSFVKINLIWPITS